MARLSSAVVRQCGIGTMSATDLKKFMAGKKVSVSPVIEELYEGIKGSSTQKDLETMLQLTYLYFTQPRKDTGAFQAFRSSIANQVRYLKDNPQMVFVDTLYKLAASNDPRYFQIPSEKQVSSLNLDEILAFYKERFADAEGFRFFFVGSFQVDSLIPLVQKYLGSLPDIHRKDMYRDVSPKFPDGITKATVHKGTEPKSLVAILMEDPFDWSVTNRIIFDITTNILNIRLRETMRESQSKTYGVGLQKSSDKLPKPRYDIMINWGCAPENVNGLVRTVFQIMSDMQKNLPKAENMEKSKETIIRELQTNSQQNGYWLGKLKDTSINGDKLLTMNEITKIVEGVTPEDVREAARRFFTEDHYLQVVLMPEK
jgi:zinc protease